MFEYSVIQTCCSDIIQMFQYSGVSVYVKLIKRNFI